MTTRRLRHAAVAALLLTALSGPSFAQFGGGGGMGGGRHGRSANSNPSSSTDPAADTSPEGRRAQLTEKLYDLRLRLLITPEQSTLWDTFSNKVFDLATRLSMGRAEAYEETAVQVVQERLAEAQARDTLLANIDLALEQLYASFTPDQQRTADQYLPPVIP
jgi:hypothetical protein